MQNEKIKNFFSKKSTRSVIVIVAVLLIGLAVYLNYRWFYDPIESLGFGDNNMEDNFDDSAETNMNAQQANDYFTSAALARRQSRDEALDVLGIVSSSEDADEQTRADAQAKMSKIASDIQNEANIEALVKAKGFDECVAVIGEDTVSVIVKAETLQAKDTAQILAIVYETTGISPEKISIINK